MKKKKQTSIKKLENTRERAKILDKKINFQNFLSFSVVLGILLGTIFLIFYTKNSQNTKTSVLTEIGLTTSTLESVGSEITCTFHRSLDGVCVNTQNEVNPPIVGVMVENSLDAQPLSGISHAQVVYEAPAEGNIPRFLAIFPLDAQVKKVGPVRSARPYYIDWLSAYGDAMYMHVGGSPEALQQIRDYGLFDMNEMYNAKSFWRANNRFAPHNTYTSSDLWSTAHEKNIDEFKNDEYTAWQYDQKERCKSNCIEHLQLGFSPAYTIVWKYNQESGLFERLLNGRIQKDEDGTVYTANNVIVQETKITILDEVGRKKITTIGEGNATILSGGRATVGTWKKKSRTAPTQWFDEVGNEMKLAPGKTWVEVVESHMVLEMK